MKVIVTGSNGMLGSEICLQLLESEAMIYAIGRGENRLRSFEEHPNFHYFNIDITDKMAVWQCIEKINPDVVIHAAALTQVDDCELNKTICLSINVDRTKNLLNAVEELNCRFIYISTDFVFSGEGGPYSELDECRPVNFYGQSKLLAEELVMQSDLPWTIVRTVLLYGKTEKINRSNFVYWVRDSLVAGKSIKVVNDQVRTPTYIPDLAKGIRSIIERSAEGIFHISGCETLTPYQLAIKVAHVLKLDTRLIKAVDSTNFNQPGRRPLKTGFIIEKAAKYLGFTPTCVDDALSQIFDSQ